MKNAMKKIMSLVLVAMLLVSAIPFGASAATGISVPVTVDGRDEGTYFITLADGEITRGKLHTDMVIAMFGSTNGVTGDYDVTWTVNGAANENAPFDNTGDVKVELQSKKVVPNDPEPTVHVVKFYDVGMNLVATKEVKDGFTVSAPAASEANVPSGYDFLGWVNVDTGMPYLSSTQINCHTSFVAKAAKVETNTNTGAGDNNNTNNNTNNNNTGSNNNTNSNTGSNNTNSNTGSNNTTNNGNSYNANTGNVTNNSTSYSKFAYPVYLNIYTDTTVGTVKKTINITNGIAADGRVTLSEVKNLVPNYYTAEVAATGIIYDGLYPAQGNWVLNYVVDQKYDIIEGLYEAASNNYVYINVMLTNAKALSTSTSTSTNPKTGDEIYMAVTGLALSACALATVFYFTKKRAI